MEPEIGSKWKAGDGRIVEVVDVSHIEKRPYAVCDVLNAGPKMRRKTRFQCRYFGGWLKPI
jgi:hypothetical protein